MILFHKWHWVVLLFVYKHSNTEKGIIKIHFFGDLIFPTWLVVEFNVGWFFSLTQSDDDAAVTDSRPRAWNLDEPVESELAVWIVRPAATSSRSSGSMDPSEQASTPPNTPGFDPPQPVGSIVGYEDEFWVWIWCRKWWGAWQGFRIVVSLKHCTSMLSSKSWSKNSTLEI